MIRTTGKLVLGALALALGASTASAQDVTIGFVAHAQGDPFVQQILQYPSRSVDLGNEASVLRSTNFEMDYTSMD